MRNKWLLMMCSGALVVAVGAGAIATVGLVQANSLASRDRQLSSRLADANARLTASAAALKTSGATATSLAGQQHINTVDIDDLKITVEGLEKRVDAGTSTSDLAASAQLSNTLHGLQGDIADICTYLRAIDDPSTAPILLC